ncbi:MAG: DUF4339 domain-containing protein [Terracidiphilus sp.]
MREGKLNYYVARNGQVSGPFTEENVRASLAAGSLSPSDQIRTDISAEWNTVSDLFQIPQTTTAPGARGRNGPVPPNLHWLVLLLLYITWIFPFIWTFVQASFARKIDRDNNSIIGFVIAFLFAIIGMETVIFHAMDRVQATDRLFMDLMRLGSMIAYLFGVFSVRRSMEAYYTKVEPIQLRLSGGMTFFFGILYLQYHMSRIARWKKTGILVA